jgi:predicted solute-binding protein
MAQTLISFAAGDGLRVSALDRWRSLRGLRVGCVKYLNSRPLIHAYDGPVVFDHPSALARMLAAGQLDTALVPLFETLRTPRYWLVDGVAVASDGPVYSVFLAYRGELRDVRRVALDPASLTSAHLLRILLAEFHGLRPEFGSEGDAQLLIGNQAIEFRLSAAADGWNILDLGEEWKRCTGLPFVFAVWAVRPGLDQATAVAQDLRALKAAGLAQMAAIVGGDKLATLQLREWYLTRHIVFEIGEKGRTAVERYREMLARHGYIDAAEEPLRWV